MKTCTACKQSKLLIEFPLSGGNGRRSSRCKPCKNLYDREYSKTKLDKLKRRVKIKIRRSRNSEYILNYLKSNPCIDCGESDPIVLEFDHITNKKFNISEGKLYSIEKIREEIEKCEVRCANCHRRKTYFQFNFKSKS